MIRVIGFNYGLVTTFMIAIIDYGAGNLRSVSRAVALYTQDYVVTQDPAASRARRGGDSARCGRGG